MPEQVVHRTIRDAPPVHIYRDEIGQSEHQPDPSLLCVEIDYERRLIRTVVQGQAPMTAALSGTEGSDVFSCSRFDFAARELHLTLVGGGSLVVDVGQPGQPDTPPAGVAVVYLDQNHWVAVARRANGVAVDGDTEAIDRLLDAVRVRQMILPLSSAHFVELPGADGRRRRELALTMLSLSRGWFMRSPVHIRKAELRRSMTNDGTDIQALTRDPSVVSVDGPPPYVMRTDGPSHLRETFARLVDVSSWYAAVLDGGIDKSEGRHRAESWSRWMADLGQQLRPTTSPERKRAAVTARFLVDLGREPVEAAGASNLTGQAFDSWVQGFPESVASQPFLVRYGELLRIRLGDSRNKWEGNDLFDMLFLGCAAAYLDVVVGEKKTIDHLRRCDRRYGPVASLHTDLASAMQAARTTMS